MLATLENTRNFGVLRHSHKVFVVKLRFLHWLGLVSLHVLLRQLLANLLSLYLHMLLDSIGAFSCCLKTLFGDHHLRNVNMHGLL